MTPLAKLGDVPPVRWSLLLLWIGGVVWLRVVIPVASFESEGAAFAVWSRVGLPLALITWLWVYRRYPTARAPLATLVVGVVVWSILLILAAGHGLSYALRDAYFLRQPVRVFLISGMGMLFLLLPPAIAVAGLFAVLTDRRRSGDPSA
ncbi:MAG: hypothetical protein BMS9Abin29_1613 [Gemmatimonadota bacterium]|nr:MAG: hypothetical protein BMS9Abin29_1613 [Gemmatimonadota bacterium]